MMIHPPLNKYKQHQPLNQRKQHQPLNQYKQRNNHMNLVVLGVNEKINQEKIVTQGEIVNP